MLTSFIKGKQKPLVTPFYELHRGFLPKGMFKLLYQEVEQSLINNSSRKSCVMYTNVSTNDTYYTGLPLIEWRPIVTSIKAQLLQQWPDAHINLVLIHYYHDNNATIAWHSDREALDSNIYSISVGGTRRFCLRKRPDQSKDQSKDNVLTFDLHDGDLFIMKIGCQDQYQHCIKSIKEFKEPRLNLTFRSS